MNCLDWRGKQRKCRWKNIHNWFWIWSHNIICGFCSHPSWEASFHLRINLFRQFRLIYGILYSRSRRFTRIKSIWYSCRVPHPSRKPLHNFQLYIRRVNPSRHHNIPRPLNNIPLSTDIIPYPFYRISRSFDFICLPSDGVIIAYHGVLMPTD